MTIVFPNLIKYNKIIDRKDPEKHEYIEKKITPYSRVWKVKFYIWKGSKSIKEGRNFTWKEIGLKTQLSVHKKLWKLKNIKLLEHIEGNV